MKKKQFTEHQIIKILKEQQQGKTVDEICRSNNVSSATFYRWKSKYSGMEASDIKRIKELESENSKLKKMYAEAMIDNAALKDVLSKKW